MRIFGQHDENTPRQLQDGLGVMGYGWVSFWESDIRQAPELVRARLRALRKEMDEDATQD